MIEKLKVQLKEESMKYLILILILSLTLFGCVQPTSTEANVDGNNEPVINDVIKDPPLIRVGASTTITVNATDPDGDLLSYSWAVALGDIIGSGKQRKTGTIHCCLLLCGN
jgi:PBP1b-binding outer membrane lipoprotein LpoB